MSATAAISRTILALAALTLLAGCSALEREDAASLGEQECARQNYAEAVGYFDNSINRDPRDYRSFYYLGVCYDHLKDYERAVQSYKAGLKVRPLTYEGRDDQEYFLKLMDGLAIAITKSKARDAEIDAMEAQAAKSKSAYDYFVLGKISRYSGDADRAVQNYNHAVMLDPRNFVLLKEYGLYLQQLNQIDQARRVLSQAGAINQEDRQVATALRQLGVVPGPSLMEKTQLEQPLIPRGPIPPFTDITTDITRTVGLGGHNNPTTAPSGAAATPAAATVPPASSSLQAPHD